MWILCQHSGFIILILITKPTYLNDFAASYTSLELARLLLSNESNIFSPIWENLKITSSILGCLKCCLTLLDPGFFYALEHRGGDKNIPPCKMPFWATNHAFFILNRNSTWFQLSLEVYNVSVCQNLKFCHFCRFLTLKNSKFQIFS